MRIAYKRFALFFEEGSEQLDLIVQTSSEVPGKKIEGLGSAVDLEGRGRSGEDVTEGIERLTIRNFFISHNKAANTSGKETSYL